MHDNWFKVKYDCILNEEWGVAIVETLVFFSCHLPPPTAVSWVAQVKVRLWLRLVVRVKVRFRVKVRVSLVFTLPDYSQRE